MNRSPTVSKSRENATTQSDGRHEPAVQPRRRDETCLVPESGEPEHDVCDNRPIAVLCAQRPVERRPARGPAGLRRPTRLAGQRLQIPVFREGTAERLSAPAENGVGQTEGLAGPFAAVRAGDQDPARKTMKGPPDTGQVMSGRANHTEPTQGTRGRIGHVWMRQRQSPPNIPRAQGPLKPSRAEVCPGISNLLCDLGHPTASILGTSTKRNNLVSRTGTFHRQANRRSFIPFVHPCGTSLYRAYTRLDLVSPFHQPCLLVTRHTANFSGAQNACIAGS